MKKIPYVLALFTFLAVGCSQKENTNYPKVVELNKDWSFHQADQEEWMPATVPGCVHTDLINNKKIEDPFYRTNERKLQWIDKKDWEYKTTFHVDAQDFEKQNIDLSFKGLDTYADVYVNDHLVLKAFNMHREWEVDVKKALKPGDNQLRIYFHSPINKGIELYDSYPYRVPTSDVFAVMGEVPDGKEVSCHTRKAGYMYGWDWGPRLATSGVWRPVYLKFWNGVNIKDLHVVQNSVNEKEAHFTANVQVTSNEDKKGLIAIKSDRFILETQEVDLKKGTQEYPVEFIIKNPKLWWPNGMGEHPLYTITAKVGDKTNGDELSCKIGIRTIEVVREDDKEGKSFYFKVNGVPVFMKGADYIPNDIFPSRVSEQQYKKLVNTAVISNFNMLRVWGGGYYEDNKLYDLCDENGILIWQDFMFACTMVPGGKEFQENVRQEAIDNVKRLRNHPSIAMWCGNNECLSAWIEWHWKDIAEKKDQKMADEIWKAYTDIFHHILPDVVKHYDRDRFYHSSSPSSDMGECTKMVNGDAHYWGVWHGKQPFTSFAERKNMARFMSEYGFQSFPELRTVKKFAEPKDYDILSEVMKSHQRSPVGNGLIKVYMERHYNIPSSFEDFLYTGQILQAEGIKSAIEAHRRNRPYCMGTLYWQLNDCWPAASWASTDYLQRWKALQYFAKKAFEPVILAVYAQEDLLKIDAVNDKLENLTGDVIIKIEDFHGKELKTETLKLSAQKNGVTPVLSEKLKEYTKGLDLKNCVLKAEYHYGKDQIAEALFYFEEPKNLALTKTDIKTEVSKTKEGYEVTLSTDVLAKNVYLEVGDSNDEYFFSDNYFDLLPNEKRTITCTSDIEFDAFKKSLHTVDLNNL